MASGNPLPLELVEIVLEYFFGLYPTINPPDTTLFNCSLVCRSWHPIAQSIRFSELVLPYSYGRWPPIVSALKRNPTLFQYVRSVLITNVRSLEVAEILSLLPNLRRVSIVHRMLSRKVAGGRADELMNVAMNLTSLHLGRVLDFPLEVFYLCSALQDLKIRNTTFLHPIAGAYGGLGLNQPRPRLKSLYIGVQNAARDIEILNWFCQPQCAFDLSEFISFRCVDHTEEIETHELVKRFVQLVSPTIQDLTMQLPAEHAVLTSRALPESFSFTTRLHHLRSIQLTIEQEMESQGVRLNHVPWALSLFNSLPPHNKVEEISILCFLYTHLRTDDEITEGIRSSQLLQFDDLFMHPKFSALEKVTIGALLEHSTEAPNKSHLERTLEEAFPRLRERKMLTITFPEVTGYMSYQECWWVTPWQLSYR